MDDPWGSPWAATDSDKDQKLASPAKSDLAPPPRAFLSASSSPRIPAVSEQSPWGGDDTGFGEWATGSETPSAHAVWAGGWGSSSPNLAPTPRDDAGGRTSPIAWPGNVATPKPANGSAFRHPSPDPWAGGFSSRRPSNDGVSTPRLVVEAASPVDTPSDIEIDAMKTKEFRAEEGSGWNLSDVGETSEQAATPDQEPLTVTAEDVGHIEEQVARAAPSPDVRVSVESAAQGHDDQSSAAPSIEHTDREDDREDSPISSVEEDSRPLPPQTRKASGKVQELVVKFDGLARAASEEPVTISRGRSRSPLSVGERDGSDDAADFGDFEDVGEDEQPPASEPPASEPPIAESSAFAEQADETLGAADVSATLRTPAADHLPPPSSPIAQFGPLDFRVDLTLLGKLFTGPPESVTDPALERDLPDHIINDSFTEISERKTWYRVSRLGSSRRHNAGDDDSYRRITWPASTVHNDTIKIVRRWMEEDSIAGRVALGGGISKTQKNMFGWDSSAEPVALDAVFGKKKSHSRASSLQPRQVTSLSLEGIDGSAAQTSQGRSLHRPSGSAGPGIASFGWSSSPPAAVGQTRQTSLLRGPPDPGAAASDSQVSTPDALRPPQPPVSSKSASKPTGLVPLIPPAQAQGGDIPDEDDEWGEMVSSPTTSQPIKASSAVQQPLTVPISAEPEAQSNGAVDVTHTNEPPPSGDWGAADFSVFESAPAKSASHMQTPPTDPSPVELSVKGPAPAPNSGAAVAGPSGPTMMYGSGQGPVPIGTPRTSTSETQQHQDDTEAQRIIASLPDLSYMLR